MNFCLIEQNIVKSNTPPTRDSRENRLSFFYADRQREILISCRDFRQFDGNFQFSLKSLLSLKREFSPAHHSEAPRALRALDTHAVT